MRDVLEGMLSSMQEIVQECARKYAGSWKKVCSGMKGNKQQYRTLKYAIDRKICRSMLELEICRNMQVYVYDMLNFQNILAS